MALTQDTNGYYVLTHRDKSVERYYPTGKIVSETSSSGQISNYGYDTNNRLSTVTDHFGHRLTFGYNASNRVATVTEPDPTHIIYYDYDDTFPTPVPATPVGNLTRVRYPDGTAKLYHYNEPSLTSGANLPHHLTGISFVDANNVTTRFGSYEYYYNSSNAADPNNGKAIRTEHAVTDNIGPQEKFTLAYDTATQTTVTDPVNVKEVMTFQVNLGVKNLVAKVNQSDNPLKPLQQTFDGNNNLTCRKDEEGRVSTYTYNPTNQRESLTEGLAGDCSNPPTSASNTPVTRTIYYKYLSPTLDLPTEIKSPSVFALQSKLTMIGYGITTPGNPCYGQPLYLPCQIVQSGFTPTGTAVSRTVTLGYNASGQVTSINGPRLPDEPGMNGLDDVTLLKYNECTTGSECGQLMKVTNALNHVTNYNSYDANGRVTQLTDPNGLVTVYEYDPRGRVRFIRQTPPGGGTRVTEYTYKPWGDVYTFTTPDGVTLTYGYDAAHSLRTVTDNVGNQVKYHYDLKGNRDGEDTHDPDGTLVRTLSYSHDLRNRLKQIDAAGSITQLVFDAVGNLRSETDPQNNPATTHTPDPLNRLVQTIDRIGGQTDYDYDVHDRLKQVIAPGDSGNRATTEYQYDDLGNLLKETSPDRGPSSYTYDSAGNVKTMTDARNVLVTYTYDALNRPTFLDYPFADDDVTFRYDAPGIGEPPCPNGRGRLCRAVSSGENQSYGYDAYGNVVDLTHQIGSVSFVSHYRYDAGDRVKTITYPSGMVITYGRDPAGRIQSVTRTDVVPSVTLLGNRLYRADGRVKNQTFGNNLVESRAHDLQGRLLNQFVGNVYARTYPVYDPNGNVKQVFANAIASAFGGNYDYDPLDRLTQDTPIGAGTAHAFDYDGNGNRKLDNTVSYIYAPSTNRLNTLGGTAFSYDAAGNIQTDAFGRSYTYDAPGRLKTATVNGVTTSYAYNAFGQRTQKNRQNLASVYYYTGLHGELLAETDGSGIPLVEYVYADATPIVQIRYAPDPGSTAAPPTLSGFWPGAAGSSTAVFVFGSGFVTGQTQVGINGINAPLVQVMAPDLLIFYPPANNLSGLITVTTAQGSVTGTTTFGVPLSGVKISGLSPAQGFAGTVVFVFGSGFVAGQTQVRFNQTQTFLVQVLDPSLVLAIVPPGATTGAVTVTTPLGSATSSTPFTVWGNGGTAGATVTYLHADQLGTPRAATNQSGQVVWRWEGEACGATLPTGSATVNLRFPGMVADQETGLFYNWNRYLDPKTCRYIQFDPVGVVRSIGAAQMPTLSPKLKQRFNVPWPQEVIKRGLNQPYTYAFNNPLRFTDPNGLSSFDDFGDWIEKEQYIQSTLNQEGTAAIQNWIDFTTTWGEVSATALGAVGCPVPSKETVRKTCVVLGICSATVRGETLEDLVQDYIRRNELQRASEIVRQQTKTLVK